MIVQWYLRMNFQEHVGRLLGERKEEGGK